METARNNAAVDRRIAASSSGIDAMMHRRFYPWTGTRYFPWPVRDSRSSVLELGEHDLVSVTSIISGGTTIAAADYFLEPANEGPPYDSIEIDAASSAAFDTGDTWQRNVVIDGVWSGAPLDPAPAGTLAAAVTTTTATSIDVTDAGLIGVGDILLIGTERMIVTERAMLDTGQDSDALSALNNDVTVNVADGTALHAGETVLLDSERMRIADIAGNVVTVERAWDGSVLAAHTAPSIYAARRLTVSRGALGTTASTHLISAAITKQQHPALITELCVAEAVNMLMQAASGWARTVGSNESEREAMGRGLKDLRREAMAAHGRMMRSQAI